MLRLAVVRCLGKEKFTLAEFVEFIADERQKGGIMDQHIRPQVEITAFDSIEYQFIGKFETLDPHWDTISRKVFGRTLPLGFQSPKKTSSDLSAVTACFDPRTAVWPPRYTARTSRSSDTTRKTGASDPPTWQVLFAPCRFPAIGIRSLFSGSGVPRGSQAINSAMDSPAKS